MNVSFKNLAKRFLEKGEIGKASLIYKYLCKVDFSVNNLVEYCKILSKSKEKNDLLKSIKLLNDLIDNIKLNNEDLCEVKKIIGNAYCNLKEYKIARVFYDNALKLKQNDDNIISNIAITYYMENNYKDAIDNFNIAIKINKINVQAITGLAILYFDIKDLQNALSFLKQSFELNNSNIDVISMLCKLYFEYNVEFNIRNYIELYLKHDSLNVDILYLYSIVLFKQKEYKYCELELLKINELDPSFKPANELFLFLNKRKELSKTKLARV